MRVRAEKSRLGATVLVLPAACVFVLQSLTLGFAMPLMAVQTTPASASDVSAVIERVRLGPTTEALLTEALSFGSSLLRKGRYTESAELYGVLLEKWPSDSRVFYGAALSTFNLGRPAKAEPLAQKAVEISLAGIPKMSTQTDAGYAARLHAADALVLWAVILGVRGNESRALETAKRAVELAPKHFDAQFTLGRALYSSGDYEGAVRSFRAAVAMVPDDSKALFFLATTLERAGRLDEALKTYRTLTITKPKEHEGHLGLGVLLVKRAGAEREEGISELKRALALNPKSYEAYVALGRTLVSQGRAAEAVEPLIRAAELAPGNPEPHYQLSLAYRRLGRKKQAAEEAAIVKKIHEARRLGRQTGMETSPN